VNIDEMGAFYRVYECGSVRGIEAKQPLELFSRPRAANRTKLDGFLLDVGPVMIIFSEKQRKIIG
jgi:hypothetical protein